MIGEKEVIKEKKKNVQGARVERGWLVSTRSCLLVRGYGSEL